MEKICGIYKITNSVNGKVYVGQSVNVLKRWKDHIKSLISHTHINRHLQSAFDKYGPQSFSFSVIERCDKTQLDEREQYWIRALDSFGCNGYNLTAGGEGNQGWRPRREDFQHLFLPVICLNTLQRYECVQDAERSTNIGAVSISRCCRGKQHYAGTIDGERLVWMFLNDYNTMSPDALSIQKIIDDAQHFRHRQPRMKSIVCLNNGMRFFGLQSAADYAGCKNISQINGCALGRYKSAGKHPATGERLVFVYLDEYKKLTQNEIESRVFQANNFDYSDIRSVPVVCLNDRHAWKSATEAAKYYGISQPCITTNCAHNSGSAGYYGTYRQRLVFVYKATFEKLSEAEICNRVKLENRNIEYIGHNLTFSKPVICMNTHEIFPNAVHASKKYGVTAACIRMACRGTAGCAGRHPDTWEKLKWKYIDDALPDELALVAS